MSGTWSLLEEHWPEREKEPMAITDEDLQPQHVDQGYTQLDAAQDRRMTMLKAADEALPDADIKTKIQAAHWIEHGQLPVELR